MLCYIDPAYGRPTVVHFDGSSVQKHHPISVAFFVRPSARPVVGRRGYTLSISVYSIVGRQNSRRRSRSPSVDAGRLGRDGSSRSRRAAY